MRWQRQPAFAVRISARYVRHFDASNLLVLSPHPRSCRLDIGPLLLRQTGTIFSIQLLRCVAATLVVLFHAQQAYSKEVTAAVLPQEGYLFGFGAVGVHIFFVISGFIMVLTSVRPDKPYEARKFFRRRLLRIYPIYWLCVLAYVAVHALIGTPYDLTLGEAVKALLLWPSSASLFIGPAWTLTYEMFFYICFGFAMMLSLTRGLIALFLAFGALIAVGQIVTFDSYDLVVITNLLLAEFLAGAAIGWLAHMHLLPLRWGPALTALGIGLFAAGMVADYTRWPSVVVWGVPSTILVLGVVCWETARGASPLVKRLSLLGDSSYVLYLIHILVIAVVLYISRDVPPSLIPSPPMAALLIALACIVIAEAIHRGIERPMLALLNPRRSLVPVRAREIHQP
jgi:exopolysaccharide production protein ExoZ